MQSHRKRAAENNDRPTSQQRSCAKRRRRVRRKKADPSRVPQPQTSPSTCVPQETSASVTRLQDLPCEVIKHILDNIIRPALPGYLCFDSLERAASAYALCCNDRNLYATFRSYGQSLILNSQTTVNGEGLARVFGKALNTVVINKYPGTSDFLKTLVKRGTSLEKLVLANANFGDLPASLQLLANASFSSLRDLKIVGKMLWKNTYGVPCLPQLTALSLHGCEFESESGWKSLFKSSGIALRRLTISKELIHPAFIRYITRYCRALERIVLSGDLDVRNAQLCNLATSCRKSLTHFEVSHGTQFCPLTYKDVLAIATSCRSLSHVSFSGTVFAPEPDAMSGLELRASTLRSLCLFYPKLDPLSVNRMADNLLGLRNVSLRGCELAHMVDFCEKVGPRLIELDIESGNLGHDSVLCAIACCVKLQDLSLKVSGNQVEPFSLHSNSMKLMLQNIGPTLRTLSWDMYVVWRDLTDAQVEHAPEQLSGAKLAQSLWTYCPKLLILSLRGMEPRKHANAFYFAAFDEMREKMPQTVVQLDDSGDGMAGNSSSDEEGDG